jgi:hypothetical protein
VVVRLVHTGLGSSYPVAHVLHYPPPPSRTALVTRAEPAPSIHPRISHARLGLLGKVFEALRSGGAPARRAAVAATARRREAKFYETLRFEYFHNQDPTFRKRRLSPLDHARMRSVPC